MIDKTPAKPTKATKKVAKVVSRRLKIDWDAVRRDYRTDRFTDIELAAKHNVTREAIGRRRKKEPDQWIKDLSQAIRDATDHALVTSVVSEDHSKITTTVLAVAELNKQVLLNHRDRLTGLADAVEFAKNVIIRLSENVNDIKDAATLAQAINSLTTSTKNLIDKERENFKLNDAPPPDDRERESAIAGMLAAIGRSAFPVAK